MKTFPFDSFRAAKTPKQVSPLISGQLQLVSLPRRPPWLDGNRAQPHHRSFSRHSFVQSIYLVHRILPFLSSHFHVNVTLFLRSDFTAADPFSRSPASCFDIVECGWCMHCHDYLPGLPSSSSFSKADTQAITRSSRKLIRLSRKTHAQRICESSLTQ